MPLKKVMNHAGKKGKTLCKERNKAKMMRIQIFHFF